MPAGEDGLGPVDDAQQQRRQDQRPDSAWIDRVASSWLQPQLPDQQHQQRQRDVEHVELHPARAGASAACASSQATRREDGAGSTRSRNTSGVSRVRTPALPGNRPSGDRACACACGGTMRNRSVSGWAKEEAVYCIRAVGRGVAAVPRAGLLDGPARRAGALRRSSQRAGQRHQAGARQRDPATARAGVAPGGPSTACRRPRRPGRRRPAPRPAAPAARSSPDRHAAEPPGRTIGSRMAGGGLVGVRPRGRCAARPGRRRRTPWRSRPPPARRSGPGPPMAATAGSAPPAAPGADTRRNAAEVDEELADEPVERRQRRRWRPRRPGTSPPSTASA